MIGPDPSPLLVLACDGCATAYQATGEQATTLRAMPAHTATVAGGLPPTDDERAEYLVRAGEYAHAAGWAVVPDTGAWRCPRCRQRYGDAGSPRRFTVREVIDRHRALT